MQIFNSETMFNLFSKHHLKSQLKKHFRALKFQSKTDTPILDALEDQQVNASRFIEFILEYGDILEWGTSYHVINKLKSNKFHEVLTPAQGVQEGSACLVDFMRQVTEEAEKRQSKVE